MEIQLSGIAVQVEPGQRTLFKVPALTIKSGEKLLIKGPSGKGKTTFLHLLSGLLVPAAGQLRIGGTDLSSLTEEGRALFRRRHIGLVFQKLNLIEHLTLIENIELSLRDRHETARALKALEAVGLSGRENDRTAVLSLGEQQRVAIARVLAGDPDLVFADEPTSSLDEKNAGHVMRLLSQACKEKTLIVVSHDQRIEGHFTSILNFEEFAHDAV